MIDGEKPLTCSSAAIARAMPGIDMAPRVTVSRTATARVSITSVNR
jgi:hypothetical protein